MNFYSNTFYFLIDLFYPKKIISNFKIYLKYRKKISKLKNKKFESFNETIFMMGRVGVEAILMQVPQIFACKRNKLNVIILLSTPCWSIQKIYKKFGVNSFLYYQNFFQTHHSKTEEFVDFILKGKNTSKKYLGIDLLKILTSTEMRLNKRGFINFNAYSKRYLNKKISNCLNIADFSQKFIREFKPKKFFFEDRGYIPEGIFFSNAIYNGIDVIEVHTGHKSGVLVYKRYNIENKDRHPYSISKSSFEKIKKKKISEFKKKEVFNELESCYIDGDWFSEVGTAFFKKTISRNAFLKKLSLNPNKKLVILFAHILWDATLFWGKDLFKNYEEWLIKSVKHMIKINNVSWVIKCHPANLVKNRRDGTAVFSEIEVLKREFGELPKNIKIINPDSDISTLSLFSFIDCCVTVRGTVGIEAACFGIPVITAGTGRYDNLGFTYDSNNKAEYFKKLSNVGKLRRLTLKEKDLAIKFLYTSLISSTLKTELIRFKFEKDNIASLKINMNHNKNPFKSNDVLTISKWLNENDEDLFNSKKL